MGASSWYEDVISLPFSAKVWNARGITSMPPVYFCGVVLRHRSNFTFSFFTSCSFVLLAVRSIWNASPIHHPTEGQWALWGVRHRADSWAVSYAWVQLHIWAATGQCIWLTEQGDGSMEWHDAAAAGWGDDVHALLCAYVSIVVWGTREIMCNFMFLYVSEGRPGHHWPHHHIRTGGSRWLH